MAVGGVVLLRSAVRDLREVFLVAALAFLLVAGVGLVVAYLRYGRLPGAPRESGPVTAPGLVRLVGTAKLLFHVIALARVLSRRAEAPEGAPAAIPGRPM